MENKARKMSKKTKRTLVIVCTIIGAVALALIIGFTPACVSCSNSVNKVEDKTVVDVPSVDVESDDYENMTKEQLVEVVKDRDAQIKVLEDKLGLYTDTTNVGAAVGSPNSGNDSSKDKDKDNDNEDKDNDDKKPSSSTTDKKPSTTDDGKKPSSSTTDKKPSATDDDKKPSSSTSDKKPSTTDEDEKPSNSDFSETGL